MKGFIHIYCGDGKGKTTAATGLAVRMAGSGGRVLFVRFLKNENSSELVALRQVEGIEVVPCAQTFGFYNRMSEARKREAKIYYSEMLNHALQRLQEDAFGLLVLDEILWAYGYELVDRGLLTEFLKRKPESLEVVLTGQNPPKELTELADYITEMKKVKHPYDQGIPARRGVEY